MVVDQLLAVVDENSEGVVDALAKDKVGRSAGDLAESSHHKECMTMLREAETKRKEVALKKAESLESELDTYLRGGGYDEAAKLAKGMMELFEYICDEEGIERCKEYLVRYCSFFISVMVICFAFSAPLHGGCRKGQPREGGIGFISKAAQVVVAL